MSERSERTTTLNGVQVNETQLREALERIEREKREDRAKPFMDAPSTMATWTFVNIPVRRIREVIATSKLTDDHFIALGSDGWVGYSSPDTPYGGPFLGFKESK